MPQPDSMMSGLHGNRVAVTQAQTHSKGKTAEFAEEPEQALRSCSKLYTDRGYTFEQILQCHLHACHGMHVSCSLHRA